MSENQQRNSIAYFTAGPGRQTIKEGGGWQEGGDLIWNPSGWHTSEGRVRIPLGYAGSIEIGENGKTRVYYYGKRCW